MQGTAWFCHYNVRQGTHIAAGAPARLPCSHNWHVFLWGAHSCRTIAPQRCSVLTLHLSHPLGSGNGGGLRPDQPNSGSREAFVPSQRNYSIQDTAQPRDPPAESGRQLIDEKDCSRAESVQGVGLLQLVSVRICAFLHFHCIALGTAPPCYTTLSDADRLCVTYMTRFLPSAGPESSDGKPMAAARPAVSPSMANCDASTGKRGGGSGVAGCDNNAGRAAGAQTVPLMWCILLRNVAISAQHIFSLLRQSAGISRPLGFLWQLVGSLAADR